MMHSFLAASYNFETALALMAGFFAEKSLHYKGATYCPRSETSGST